MILADKIIELRKKNGWSQEELADRLNVSRQSVSKWEGAQSVPDMNKILMLSELFGVSTDYLLKDELSLPESTDVIPVDTEPYGVRVSMEEASGFLSFKGYSAFRIALGVLLCILSPVLLVLLSGLQEAGRLAMTEAQATGIGVAFLLVLVGTAVAFFVVTGIQGKQYEYFEKEMIDTEYGVDGMVRDRREKYRPTYTTQLTLGIVLCVFSVIPIFLAMTVFGDGSDLPYIIAVCILLIIIAFGVFLIVRSSILWGGFNQMLEEGDYSRQMKSENKKNDPVATVYWCLVIALYLGYSFVTNDWGRSWIVWPVAGVLFGAIEAILRIVRKNAC